MAETVSWISKRELVAEQANTLLGVVDQYQDAYMRGIIVDTVDHKKHPFKGAERNLWLVNELMPHLSGLIELTGDRIRFGHTRFISRFLGYGLEIGKNGEGEVGLKLAGEATREYPTPIIRDQNNLQRTRVYQDRGAVEAFGTFTGIELLDQIGAFALRNQRRRIPIPSSSRGQLPWV